jgi:CheY-like chemotaxis protein
MADSREPEQKVNLSGSRIGLLGFPAELSAELGCVLKSAECLSSNLPATSDDATDPLEAYDVLFVWAGEEGTAPRAEELGASSQPWLLFGSEEQIRQNTWLYLRADDVVFTPYSLNELLFRIYRTIHRMSIGSQHLSERRKPAVLVADDDPAMLTLLETVLRSSEWDCHFATNGRQALTMARKLLPDLLVLDIEMPFMTGLEVLRRIRDAQMDGVGVKVLLLTGSSELKHVEEGLSLGASDYLAKPFSHVALLHRVRKLLFPPRPVLPALKKADKPA